VLQLLAAALQHELCHSMRWLAVHHNSLNLPKHRSGALSWSAEQALLLTTAQTHARWMRIMHCLAGAWAHATGES